MTRPLTRAGAAVALAVLGFTTAVAQAALLRESMAAVGGSELAWGAVLALWLAGLGAGAWVGAGGRFRVSPAAAPVAAAALALAGVTLLRLAPWLAGRIPGETPLAGPVLWLAALAVLPPAVAAGLGFPAMAAGLAGPRLAGNAYALEAAGALAGGVAFTFLLAPLGSVAAAVVGLAAALAAWLALAGRARLAVVALLAVAAAARPLSLGVQELSWRLAGRGAPLVAWRETREQRLELGGGPARSLYADGQLVATVPDPYRTEQLAHLAMLLHPRPARVLAVSVAARGALPAILEHPVRRVEAVEEDAALLGLLPEWYGGATAAALSDPRVEARGGDPLRAVRGSGEWDLILLLDPDPSTLRRNRTRTAEFFRACAGHLAPGGRVVVGTGVSDTFVEGGGGALLACLSATLRGVFPVVEAVPGDEVLLVGGEDRGAVVPGAAELLERIRRRGLDDGVLPAVLAPRLEAERRGALEMRLRRGAPVNTVARPRAVMLAAALSEGRGAPRLLVGVRRLAAQPWPVFAVAVVTLMAVLLVTGWRRARPGVVTAAVVGFTSLGWWLLLLDAWQSTVGSVYAEVGGLAAAFMGGLVVGAGASRGGQGRPRLRLAVVLLAGVGLSLLTASGVPWRWPRAAVLPMLLGAGIVTGAAFPLVAALAAGVPAVKRAGRSFGADEAGGAAAAVVVGLVAVPWVGMTLTALGLAGLGLAAAAAVALGGGRGPMEA